MAKEKDSDKKIAIPESEADKKKALELALKQIDKAFGKGTLLRLGDKEVEAIESIPTGSLGLDLALGIGGVPKGRIIEIYGPESSGKTTLTLHIIAEAQSYAAQGVHGIDLLGYRYTGDATKLNAELVKSVSVPVCIAGSVNSYQRLDELKAARPWAFTIGSAFFDNQFSGSIAEQIDKVCAYMKG